MSEQKRFYSLLSISAVLHWDCQQRGAPNGTSEAASPTGQKGPSKQKMEIVMNSTRNSSVVTQVSTAIAGIFLAGYGLVFIAGAVIGY
jgi:hypothetical protein